MAATDSSRHHSLLNNLTDNASANSSATLTDVESQSLFHGDGSDKLNIKSGIVTRHNHLSSLLELQIAGDISSAEEKLRSVVGEEGGVAATLVLVETVDFGLEFSCGLDGTGLGKYLQLERRGREGERDLARMSSTKKQDLVWNK